MYSKKLCFITCFSPKKAPFAIYFTDNQKYRQGKKDYYFSKYLSVNVPDWSRTI